jgi:hypothetical protein
MTIARRRTLVSVLLVAASMGAAACGGGSGSGGRNQAVGGTQSENDAGDSDGDDASSGPAGGTGGSPVSSGGGTGGSATTTGGTATGGTADGCTGELAHNLVLQQVAVYQSVKIPVMTDGTEVATASRNASVIQGRDTVFRAFVTLGSDWVARELSARLTLTPEGGPATVYYARKTISLSSVDGDPSTTFQIHLAPSAMATPLRYSVEVVECTPPSGAAGQARYPAAGNIDLAAKAAGGLKVRIIPIEVDGFVPDTSDAALAGYADYMTAIYPITDISFSVGPTLTTTLPVDWSGVLDEVRALRSSDQPGADVYYFGLLKPADTLRAFCASDCTTGIGFVVTSATGVLSGSARVALGIGFADQASYETMAHELGHNHGRSHAPCSTVGDITGVDADYPYPNGAIGSWGYDARTQALLDPIEHTDIMGYCDNPWISDYTYGAIATRVAAVNGLATARVSVGAPARWRILLVDQRGPHWGNPIQNEVIAEGDPESATIYDGAGGALGTVVVYRTQIGDVDASMVMVPEPAPGWYTVAVAGAPPLAFTGN